MTAAAINPFITYTDANGLPLNGGKIYTYIAGTTTNQATYTDAAAGTPAANPIILDSSGRSPYGAIWGVGAYKLRFTTSADVDIYTIDNVQFSVAGITALTGDVTASGTGSVAAVVAKIAGVPVGTPTGSGNVVFSTSPTITNPVGTTTNDNATAGSIGEVILSACPSPGTAATVAITIASPGVITYTAHGITGIVPVVFTTSSALPTGITAGTVYYTISSTVATNTFQIATSIANAIAGTAINTSGSQSGTQTCTPGQVMATNTANNALAISLTAGDWNVRATMANYGGGGTVTAIAGAVSTTSASFPSITASGCYQSLICSTTGNQVMTLGSGRLSLSATTTIYLITQLTFGSSTQSTYGILSARRMR